tara:strand:- start:6085 stop:6417 length:333 start_codon:yes stop_codon:yes gene_type:complete
MNREDNEERRNCQRMLEKVLTGVVSRLVPYMNVNVSMKMIGREHYTIALSRQTTLHEYGDIGVQPPEGEKHDYLDIAISKTLLNNPDIGGIVSDMIDDVEVKMEHLRQKD